MEKVQIKKFLKDMRLELDLSQEKVSSLLGVSSRTYQRYESGESDIGVSQLLRMVKQYDNDVFMSLLSNLSSLERSRKLKGQNDVAIQVGPLDVANKIIELKPELKKLAGSTGTAGFKDEQPYDLKTAQYPILGYWDWNFSTNGMYWSREVFPVFGFVHGKKPDSDQVNKAIFEEDRESVSRSLALLLKEGIPYHCQFRTCYTKDSYFVVNAGAEKTLQNDETIVYGYIKAYLVEKKERVGEQSE